MLWSFEGPTPLHHLLLPPLPLLPCLVVRPGAPHCGLPPPHLSPGPPLTTAMLKSACLGEALSSSISPAGYASAHRRAERAIAELTHLLCTARLHPTFLEKPSRPLASPSARPCTLPPLSDAGEEMAFAVFGSTCQKTGPPLQCFLQHCRLSAQQVLPLLVFFATTPGRGSTLHEDGEVAEGAHRWGRHKGQPRLRHPAA
mmetsp:Transcript_42175/g.94395  ORF Transcript_42175/g.94395 Transcript_42175/m.94395 type:complete len:200 (-) Transcript_42175:2794-3393(-)